MATSTKGNSNLLLKTVLASFDKKAAIDNLKSTIVVSGTEQIAITKFFQRRTQQQREATWN
jgi:hypothetical protein